MRRSPGFTALAVATLAVGIAATNTAFTMVNTILLRDLPFDRADRIVAIGIRESGGDAPRLSVPDFRDWERELRSFDSIGAWEQAHVNVADEGRAPEQFEAAFVSSGTFGVLRVRPVLGRDFTSADDRPGSPPVVLPGEGIWRSRYGADPAILGRTIRVNTQPTTVVGIMPAGFDFPFNNKLWLPLSLMPGVAQEPRGTRVLEAIGRLADGVTARAAAAELNALNDAIAVDFPETNGRVRGEVVRFRPGIGAPWYIILGALMAAVSLLLLVGCANVASLQVARSFQRVREVAIRASLGATRWRLVRQFLFESVMISLIAGAFALLLSMAAIQVLLSFVDEIGKPGWMDFSMDANVFVFLALVCAGTGVLFGIAPALYVSGRGGSEVLAQSSGRTATAGGWAARWTGVLVIAEVILTIILLTGALSMMRHLHAQRSMDRAIDPAGLLTLNIGLPSPTYPSDADRIRFFERLEERLAAIPGVLVSMANARPFLGSGSIRVAVDGRAPAPEERLPAVQIVTIGSGYFEVLGLSLIRGRALTGADGGPGNDVIVVNDAFAKEFLGAMDPIGRSIELVGEGKGPRPVTIVGVVPALVRDEIPPPSVVYQPYRDNPTALMVLMSRSARDPDAMAGLLRDEVRGLDRDLPLFNIRTLDHVLDEVLWVNRVFGGMFTIFAIMAALIAAVGIHGVVSFTMSQRTQEIGIRIALGAPRGHLWWTMARGRAAQIVAGLAAGLVAAFLLLRLMGGLLVGRFGQDPVTLAASGALLLVVGVFAMFLPIWRASSGDAVQALRCE